MAQLDNYRVAILATDGFEEAELTEPKGALEDAGARADVISLKSGEIQAFKHHDKSIKINVDRTLDEASAVSMGFPGEMLARFGVGRPASA